MLTKLLCCLKIIIKVVSVSWLNFEFSKFIMFAVKPHAYKILKDLVLALLRPKSVWLEKSLVRWAFLYADRLPLLVVVIWNSLMLITLSQYPDLLFSEQESGSLNNLTSVNFFNYIGEPHVGLSFGEGIEGNTVAAKENSCFTTGCPSPHEHGVSGASSQKDETDTSVWGALTILGGVLIILAYLYSGG